MRGATIAAVVVLFSLSFVFLQSKTVGQYSVDISDASIIQSLDGLSGYSFSQVFGGGGTNATAADAVPDRPPPLEAWLVNPPSLAPEDRTSIPPLINKIFFQKGSGFPPPEGVSANLTAAHESWERMNPGYAVRYFDLDRARRYLHRHFHPVFLRAFDCLPAFAAKSDLFRMTLLYREGGWHSDWKQTCLKEDALRSISEGTDIFAAYDLYDSNDFFPHRCVQNAFVGARPRHPIVATVLEMILTNIQTVHYNGLALDATATCVFGRAVHASEEERNSTWFATVAGKFVDHPEYGAAFESAGEALVKHKCAGCGEYGQDWGATGNNYIQMYKYRKFYCEDAASLFSTTMVW